MDKPGRAQAAGGVGSPSDKAVPGKEASFSPSEAVQRRLSALPVAAGLRQRQAGTARHGMAPYGLRGAPAPGAGRFI